MGGLLGSRGESHKQVLMMEGRAAAAGGAVRGFGCRRPAIMSDAPQRLKRNGAESGVH